MNALELSKYNLASLETFMLQNPEINIADANLLAKNFIQEHNWENLEDQKDELLKTLKAYQRILRLLPTKDEALVKKMLEQNLHSGIQIASIPKKDFQAKYQNIFSSKEEMEQVYTKAKAIRAAVMLKHINKIQNNEPHLTSTNFN